jgi:hypothetical protein
VDIPLCIGIDLDNTIVSYDGLFYQLASDEGLVPVGFPRHKDAIRDEIRRRPEGNATWTRLQALAYGPYMNSATAFPGAIRFFERCHQSGYRVQIVSHKTETAWLDGSQVYLREAALRWLESHGFLSTLGLSKENVFFETTRQEKVSRISTLGCTHFIDDLPEVFAENHFPSQTQRLLFSPHPRYSPHPGIQVAESWEDLGRRFFEHGI